MTLKQKLEIGWNEDAPFRKDGLPDDQVPRAGDPAGPGRSAEIALACADKHIMPTADDRDDAARKGTTINTDRDDQL